MPKPLKNEVLRQRFFSWRLLKRNGMWQADGRSNTPNAGRHSLGTKDKKEAIEMLVLLDQMRAEDLGLAPRSQRQPHQALLPLDEGRMLYEKHIKRPRVAGGLKKSTHKSYRQAFDSFITFAKSRHIEHWHQVDANLLTDYAKYLEPNYAYKTMSNRLVTIKQAVKWFIGEDLLPGMTPIQLRIRKAQSQRPYCYRTEEVAAMISLCDSNNSLNWLQDVMIALACTGLRISELAALRWSDIDFAKKRLTLTDETAIVRRDGIAPRELKSGRSRSFPVHSELLAVLNDMDRKGKYVFYGPRGGRLKPDTVRRVLIREVIAPLSEQFPSEDGERGFKDGRLHSFRHYFCSTCANNLVPERMVMDWLGHADSEMIRHYYHLHDDEARRQMNQLDFLGNTGGRSANKPEGNTNEEDAEPIPESNDSGEATAD